MLTHGQEVASIIALVVCGIVAIALLAWIAIAPLRDYDASAKEIAAEPDADSAEITAVITPPPSTAYIPRHRRTEGASR